MQAAELPVWELQAHWLAWELSSSRASRQASFARPVSLERLAPRPRRMQSSRSISTREAGLRCQSLISSPCAPGRTTAGDDTQPVAVVAIYSWRFMPWVTRDSHAD